MSKRMSKRVITPTNSTQEMEDAKLNVPYPSIDDDNDLVRKLQRGERPFHRWVFKKNRNYEFGWNGSQVILREYPASQNPLNMLKPLIRTLVYNATTEKWLKPVKKNKNTQPRRVIYPGRPGSMEVANLKLKYPSSNIMKKLKNPGEEGVYMKLEPLNGKFYHYGWNGSAVTAKEYNSRFSPRSTQKYTWNATNRQWLKPRNKKTQSKRVNLVTKKHSNNNPNNNSNNNSFPKDLTSLLPPLLKSNFRMGGRTNLPPAAFTQHYINSNGKGCICHTPETWISRFNEKTQRWTIRSSNLKALNDYQRKNNAPKIGMPNKFVFQREDGMVCACNWLGSGSRLFYNNVVQQLITALVGREPSSSRQRPHQIAQLFEKQRRLKHEKMLVG